MANTLSTSLVTDVATKTAITVLQSRLAPIKNFSTDFSSEVVNPLRRLQVGVATAAGSVVSNPTSFESQGTTLTNAAVTMTHYSAQFGLSSVELNKGFTLERIMQVNLRALANQIIDAALSPISVSNFTSNSVSPVVYTSSITTATGGVLGNDLITKALPTLWGSLANGTTKNLVLDGSYYQYLLPQSGFSLKPGEGAYGFDTVNYNNRWNGTTGLTGATVASGGTKSSTTDYQIKGFVADYGAIAIASALPYIDPSVASLLQLSEVIEIPDLGISVQFNVHGSLASRSLQASFDVVVGAAVADSSALKMIVI
jgi:hypothetical protein